MLLVKGILPQMKLTADYGFFLSFILSFFTMVLKELYHLGGKIKPHPILINAEIYVCSTPEQSLKHHQEV